MGNQLGERRAAGRRREALDQVTVLGGIGNAIQWSQCGALGPACIGRLGFFQGCGVAHHHGIQRGRCLRTVIGVDPRQVSLDQLNGRGLAGLKRCAQLGNGDFGNLHHVFFAAFKWGYGGSLRTDISQNQRRIIFESAAHDLPREVVGGNQMLDPQRGESNVLGHAEGGEGR